MEIEGEDGSKIMLTQGSKRLLGRGSGFDSDDQNISRHHLSLELHQDGSQENPCSGTRVSFMVVGKNPVWVHDSRSGDIRVFRRFEMGEMVSGDKFCFSAKKNQWFKLKRKEHKCEELRADNVSENAVESKMLPENDEDFGFELPNISRIDPVKEFGFVVEGHEFDNSKCTVSKIKNLDWFLKEDGDTLSLKRKRQGRRRLDDDGESDDGDWMGEGEDDVEIAAKQASQRKRSSTRSKDRGTLKAAMASAGRNRAISDAENDDDTLGGFIVNDDDLEPVNLDDDEEDFDDDMLEEDE